MSRAWARQLDFWGIGEELVLGIERMNPSHCFSAADAPQGLKPVFVASRGTAEAVPFPIRLVPSRSNSCDRLG